MKQNKIVAKYKQALLIVLTIINLLNNYFLYIFFCRK